MNDPIRWGVLGCARVFERRMAPAFLKAGNAELIAIASRSREKAVAMAARHGIARPYDSYEALLADSEVEAVYVPLPNDLHAEWTIRALAAGKHVLCDKPAALTYGDAWRMAEAARAADRRLMEGFMCRHHPQHARIREIAYSGEIGEPVHFRGTFTYPAEGNTAGGIRWSRAHGGGALLDTGVYPVNAARLHFGPEEPVAVFAAAALDGASGVDRHSVATLEWADGRTASIEAGFDQVFTSRYEIAGRQGVVCAERAFQVGEAGVTITVRVGDDVRRETLPHFEQYALEIAHFGDCVRDPRKPLSPGEDGLLQARVVEALYRSLHEKRRIEVAEIGD